MTKRPRKKSANSSTTTVRQEFKVAFDYPVHFTTNVFSRENQLLVETLDRKRQKRRHRAIVYLDGGLAAANPALPEQINEYFHAHEERIELAAPPQVAAGGHAAKTDWRIVRDVMWNIGNLHLDRQSFIIGVGGGSFLDMIGFAASIVHRGLRLVRLPSTTLAMNDAGIGVKNGMDEHGQKNFVGTFAPPFAVINDLQFLITLKFDDWISGVAEAFKVAIIKDAAFFATLCRSAAAIRRRDMSAMTQLVRRCAEIHLHHIRTSGDPFEFGSARPLDFGHWAAHRLELISKYSVSHGLAVAIGIALDCYYAMKMKLITAAQCTKIILAMLASGLPVWHKLLASRNADGELEILVGLEQFREHLGGTLTITLPRGIGKKIEVHHMNPDLIADGIKWLKKFAAR